MGIKDLFRKKNNDEVIDLSDMQKRGIYKKNINPENKEVVDLSASSSENSESSAFGFLGNMASSNEIGNLPKRQNLKEVLREIKSDLKNTTDKVYKLSERIELIERKLKRIEGRVGF